MDKNYAQYLLKKVIQDYNLIAEDYARTRAFIPEDIRALGEHIKAGERVLDMGCGSGRLFEIAKNKNADFLGIDGSPALIEIAKKKYSEAEFQVADALDMPFPDNHFDKVYSISVIHHIPSKTLRLQYFKEANRVLKPGGLLILRVWDFWKRKEGIRLFLKYAFLKLLGISKLDFKDVFLPWRDSATGKAKVQRYFHCFAKAELEKIAKEAGFKIKKIWREGQDPRTNIYLVPEK